MTVSNFLKWVKKSHTSQFIGLSWRHKKVFYRGQANKSWSLKPSLFRENVLLENELLLNASKTIWKEIHDTSSFLEKLVIMQHHGLPTRLLDVTLNPLVALYFACQTAIDANGHETNGIVYAGWLDNEDKENIEKICTTIFNTQIEPMVENINGFDLSDEHHRAILTSTYFVNPPLNNDRIIAQNGAFIMPPLLEDNHGVLYLNEQNIKKDNVFPKTITIPQEDKDDILQELALYGIHEGTLFPNIEHKLKHVLKIVKNYNNIQ